MEPFSTIPSILSSFGTSPLMASLWSPLSSTSVQEPIARKIFIMQQKQQIGYPLVWSKGLVQILPNHVQPNLSKLAIAGHSRGGKVAVALALGTYARTSLPFSALLAVDPVDGTAKEKQTNPPILTYIPHSFELKMAALVIGSGLGHKKNLLFSPCAPNGVSHQEFFNECNPPACHLVARDYGHMDTLDDGTKGIIGIATHCMCANGKSREPMRNFVGGVMVAFMRAYLEAQKQDLLYLRDNPDSAFPLVVSIASFQLE